MRILFTNDDGLDAKGLWHAWRAFPDHEREVVAPMYNQSGASHAFTLYRTLRVEERMIDGVRGLAVAGFPADTVKFAVTRTRVPFDFVVSGINQGENSGVAQFYSGTVAGAREGALWGIPSVSISIWNDRPETYEVAAAFLRKWVPRWHEALQRDPIRPFLVNVNLPDCAPEEILGIRICYQSQAMFLDHFVEEPGSDGHSFRLGAAWKDTTAITPGSDDEAIKQRCIAVTPLQLDASSPATQNWLKKIDGFEMP